MKSVLLTGSQGFIGSHICQQLLDKSYFVYGIDNYSKYGRIKREHDNHKNFDLIGHDARDIYSLDGNKYDPDYVIACAAMIGGISYFHKYAFDLLATNEKITAETFHWAITRWQLGKLKRIIAMSSSMVFENTKIYPTPENALEHTPPPSSTYGFQKLAVEYFAKGAHEQYGLPYTIVRPFNAIGLGEEDYMEGTSHVVPDLIFKALKLKPNDALELLGHGEQIRCYTHVKDIARGIIMAMESGKAENEDYNISAPDPTSVKTLATAIWRKIHGNSPVFRYLEPFKYDVQERIPDVSKAEKDLGFRAEYSLDESLEEIIDHMKIVVSK